MRIAYEKDPADFTGLYFGRITDCLVTAGIEILEELRIAWSQRGLKLEREREETLAT